MRLLRRAAIIAAICWLVVGAALGALWEAAAWLALAVFAWGLLGGRRRRRLPRRARRAQREIGDELRNVERALRDASSSHASRYGFRMGAPGQARSEARLGRLERERDRLRSKLR